MYPLHSPFSRYFVIFLFSYIIQSIGRVLGAQIIGGEGVKARIDQIALALLLQAHVSDIANYDWCYVPPVSPVWDPLSITASQIAKKINEK